MSKETYLNLLRTYLSGRLSADEVEDITRYYAEYFADAGPAQEQAVIAELGSPEALAHQILSERNWEEPFQPPEYPQYDYDAEYVPIEHGRLPSWAVFLIFGAIVFFGWPVALGLVLGLGGAGVLCVAIGLGVVGSAFTNLSLAGALYEAGGGLIVAGVGLFLLFMLIFLCRLTVKGVRYLWDTFAE